MPVRQPEYAVDLLVQGAAGYAYLLKDRVADCDRLARAIREVATGGSMLDPEIVAALVSPARTDGELSRPGRAAAAQVAEGRPVKAIAASRRRHPRSGQRRDRGPVLAAGQRRVGRAAQGALHRLRLLHTAILDREEQGETLCRLLPGGLADRLRSDEALVGRTERLDVTVLMSDVRGYYAIAENADPAVLAGQLNTHRSR